MNTRFEAHKLKRELKRSGIDYEFKSTGKNEFNESTDEIIKVRKLKGLYHEQSSGIKITTGDTTQIRTKKSPMILCLYEDVIASELKIGDFIEINNKTLKVTGVINIQEWNIIADISLEFIDEVVNNGI